MSLFSVVHHELSERRSRKDSFKRFSIPNDAQYGSAGINISVSHTRDEGVEGSFDEAVRDSTQVLVSDDNTTSFRKVLCVRVVTHQHMESSCIVCTYRLSALIILSKTQPGV